MTKEMIVSDKKALGTRDSAGNSVESTVNEEQFYQALRSYVIDAQKKIYVAIVYTDQVEHAAR